MSHPSEAKITVGTDPVRGSVSIAVRYLRKLRVDGYLKDDVTGEEEHHLISTLADWIAHVVKEDRKADKRP